MKDESKAHHSQDSGSLANGRLRVIFAAFEIWHNTAQFHTLYASQSDQERWRVGQPSAVLSFVAEGVPDCVRFASGRLLRGGKGKGSAIRFDPIKSRVSPLY